MKQKDILLVVVIGIVSVVISFFASRLVFVKPAAQQQTVTTVESISTSFPTPDSKYFNAQSVDPTQEIQIGNSSNPVPFNGTTQ